MGVEVDQVSEKIGDVVKSWASGHDSALVTQNMKAHFPNITMPNPSEFWEIAVNTFASSMQIPTHILTGMQTGERASSEDAQEWAKTNQARRGNEIIPAINELLNRMVRFGLLAPYDWFVDWESLQDATPDQKMARAVEMASINNATKVDVFDPTEIRTAAGFPAELPELRMDDHDDT